MNPEISDGTKNRRLFAAVDEGEAFEKASKWLKLLALPRGLEPLFSPLEGHNARFSALLRTITDVVLPVIISFSVLVCSPKLAYIISVYFPYGIFPWPGPLKTPKSTAALPAPNSPGGASPIGRLYRRDARSATGREPKAGRGSPAFAVTMAASITMRLERPTTRAMPMG
jgi:hypothetical protein